jgi:hypothetical protein
MKDCFYKFQISRLSIDFRSVNSGTIQPFLDSQRVNGLKQQPQSLTLSTVSSAVVKSFVESLDVQSTSPPSSLSKWLEYFATIVPTSGAAVAPPSPSPSQQQQQQLSSSSSINNGLTVSQATYDEK